MDQPTISSPESANGSPPAGLPHPAGQRQQGALGGRRVTEAPARAQAPSIRDSRGPGSVAGAVVTQPGIRSRQAIAESSFPQAEMPGLRAGPHRRARTPDAPAGQPKNAPGLEPALHLLEKIRLDSAPGLNRPPPPTPKPNREPHVPRNRVPALRERPEDGSRRKAEVAEAVGLVSRMERELERAGELLRGMRTRLLTEAEWSELKFLMEQARAHRPRRLGRAMDSLDGLVQSGALSPREAGPLADRLQGAVDAHAFLACEELPWQRIVKRVEFPPGPDSTSTAVVESRVVTGTAFGSSFAHGYSWKPNAPLIEKILSGHVPRLEQTRLTGAAGQTLFCGLRQGFVGLPHLEPAEIAALPDVDLKRLVSEILLTRKPGDSPENHRGKVENWCHLIRHYNRFALSAALTAQAHARSSMARESAAAALCSDPEKLERAIGGAMADIKLFDVSLLAPGDVGPWIQQYVLNGRWQAGCRLRLTVGRPGVEFRQVSANASVRQFALSVEDQGPDFSNYVGLNPCVVKLLGGMDSRELGGDAKNRVKELRSRARQLGGELAGAGQARARALPPGALEHTRRLPAGNQVTALQAGASRLDRQARALEQAAQQLKDMWRAAAAWPTGADAYGAAARLALVAYLMGETPVLSCPVGRDYSRRLDADVKILATVTECQGGHVPPADLDLDAWDSARTVLRAH